MAFARSRRRSSARRRLPRRRRPLACRSAWAVVLAVAAFAATSESTLETSTAKAPANPVPAAAPAPAPCPVPHRFRAAFEQAAAKTGVPLSLLVATAWEESRMNPGAYSRAGARGLLQLLPSTAQSVRLTGDDPASNVLAGARYLREMLDRFGSVEMALAAYNAGPTAVTRAAAAPTITTLRYVLNVEARSSLLTGC